MIYILLLISLLNICSSLVVFNWAKETCCDGKIYKIKDIKSTARWRIDEFLLRNYDKNESYPNSFIDQIFTLQSEVCCGDKLYDYVTSLCWLSKIYEKPKNFQYGQFQKCENKFQILRSNEECCNSTEIYDTKYQGCCGSVYNLKGNEGTCCHNQFIRNNESCCRDVNSDGFIKYYSIPRKYQWRKEFCCDKKSFSPEYHLCCEGNLLPKLSFNHRCCGKEMFDSEIQICHEGKPVWKISNNEYKCGNSFIDRQTHRCVDGTPVPKPCESKWNEFLEPCGSSFNDNRTQVCCSETVLDIPDGENVRYYECCSNKKEWYAYIGDIYIHPDNYPTSHIFDS